MRAVLIVATLVVLFAAWKGPARLTLDFARAGDPSPRRFELMAETAGLAAGIAIRWSKARILR